MTRLPQPVVFDGGSEEFRRRLVVDVGCARGVWLAKVRQREMEATNPNALDCLVGQNSEEISTQTTGQNTHYLGLELRQELADLGNIHK